MQGERKTCFLRVHCYTKLTMFSFIKKKKKGLSFFLLWRNAIYIFKA